MIHVRVDMWPGGDKRRKYSLFEMTLANTGGTADKADYLVKIFRRPKRGRWADVLLDVPLRTGKVRGHSRQWVHIVYLLVKAIRSLYPKA